MTVSINVSAGLIFLVSCVVGFAVFRHTRENSVAVPRTGDLGVAFTAGSVTLVALAFLFGIPSSEAQRSTETPPQPVSVSSSPHSDTKSGTPAALPVPATSPHINHSR